MRNGELRHTLANTAFVLNNFAQLVRSVRVQRGWTHLDLADAINVSHKTIARVENGTFNGHMNTVIALVDWMRHE